MPSAPVPAGPPVAEARIGEMSLVSHLRGTLVLGLPLVGAQLAQMAINVTDTALIGRLGPEPLAAAVLATQTFFLVWMFGAGVLTATVRPASWVTSRIPDRGETTTWSRPGDASAASETTRRSASPRACASR